MSDRLIVLTARIDRRRLTGALAAIIVGLMLLGAVEVFSSLPLAAFDLDLEKTVPAAFSAVLLLAVAACAALAGAHSRGRSRLAFWILAGFALFMAFDEALAIHERIGHSSWLRIYAPVIAAVGLSWLAVLGELRRHGSGVRLWIAAAGVWLVSQGIEAIQLTMKDQQEGGVAYGMLAVLEEGLEMSGSAMLMLALICALASLSHPEPEPAKRSLRGVAVERLLQGRTGSRV
jgi:hypothetical protein